MSPETHEAISYLLSPEVQKVLVGVVMLELVAIVGMTGTIVYLFKRLMSFVVDNSTKVEVALNGFDIKRQSAVDAIMVQVGEIGGALDRLGDAYSRTDAKQDTALRELIDVLRAAYEAGRKA